jgi:hypothetical protein
MFHIPPSSTRKLYVSDLVLFFSGQKTHPWQTLPHKSMLAGMTQGDRHPRDDSHLLIIEKTPHAIGLDFEMASS